MPPKQRRQIVVRLPKQATVKKRTKQNRAVESAQELTRLGRALRGLGALGGSALGGLVGQSTAGSGIGSAIGASLSKWLGSGDYTVSTNTVLDRVSPDGSVPMMHKDGQTIIVRHKEFLGELRGSVNFAVRNMFSLNPGVENTFPWLASIASKFQEYKLRGAVFHYVPTSGTAISSTSAALGSVMFQTSYRSTDNPPIHKQEMLNEYWSSEARPCDAFCHPIECDPKENPYNLHYVRSGELPAGVDKLLYDMGRTFVAVSGQQSNDQVLGDIWITYEVELKKPVMHDQVNDASKAFAAIVIDNAGSITNATPFAGDVGYAPYNTMTGITLATNVITIPADLAGAFYIMVNIEAVTTFSAVVIPSTQTATGCTFIDVAAGGHKIVRNNMGGGTPTLQRCFWECAVLKTTTDATATVTFPITTLTGAAYCTNVTIFRRSGSLWN